MFKTGIEVIDLLEPCVPGSESRCSRGGRVGKAVMSVVYRVAEQHGNVRCSQAWGAGPASAQASVPGE